MKFYDSFGMNPRLVRFFMLEKGVELEREGVDIFTMENRREPYLSRNPSGQTPLLELDDGTYLGDSALQNNGLGIIGENFAWTRFARVGLDSTKIVYRFVS
jgi:hypothetical protein